MQIKTNFSCPREMGTCNYNGWFNVIHECDICDSKHYKAKCPQCEQQFNVQEKEIILKDVKVTL